MTVGRKFAARLLLALGLGLAVPLGLAAERITEFHADIVVAPDAMLTVTERIAIVSEGLSIRRGIVREFPTLLADGSRDRDFEMVSATRNGVPEPFEVTETRAGVDIRLGDEDTRLARGAHVYQIVYRTGGQVRFFETVDELYWNVTGDGWIWPIERASARIVLPDGAAITAYDAYTGARGESGRDATAAPAAPNVLEVSTTRRLEGLEGLTIAVQWPSGVVRETGKTGLLPWLGRNLSLLLGGGGFLAALGIMLFGWRRDGRDPPIGTIIPLFVPPLMMSPAEARYLRRKGYDDTALAAMLVDLAARDIVEIVPPEGRSPPLLKLVPGQHALSRIEEAVTGRLFETSNTVRLGKADMHPVTMAAYRLKSELGRAYGDRFPVREGYSVAAILVLLCAVIAALSAMEDKSAADIAGVLAAVSGFVMVALFRRLMIAPSPQTQQLRAGIEGFRMFLDTAERGKWETLHPPEMTVELFEKYFPYALALDVEQSWSEAFRRTVRVDDPAAAPSRFASGVVAGLKPAAFAARVRSAVDHSPVAAGRSGSSGIGSGRVGGGGGGGGGRGW